MPDRTASGFRPAPARLVLVGFTLLAVAVVALEVVRGGGSTTFEPRARRPAAVVTDGRRILEVEARTGRVAATLLALPTTGEDTIVALAPRPGALRGLPLMVLSHDGDRPALWWVDDGGRRRDVPATLQPASGTSAFSVAPGPVWSPDGAHVAWLDGTPGAPLLRIVAWSADGPRAQDPRHVRADLAMPLGPGARLEAWRWDDPGAEAEGSLLISDDRPGLYRLGVRRDGGRVRLERNRPTRLPGELVDRADAWRTAGQPPWPRYTLVLPMERGNRPQLRWSAADSSSGTLPLPEGITGTRSRWWLDAFANVVLVGDGRRAWALRPDGVTVEIPGTVVHGAALERVTETGGRVVAPSTPGRRLE